MAGKKLESLKKNWQSWALAIGLIGVAWFTYALFLQRPQGVVVGDEHFENRPACMIKPERGRHHYRAAHFRLYYYSEGCAALDGGIARDALELIEEYDDNLAAFGLPRVQSDTAALMLPDHNWELLGTPGVGRGIVIGIPRRAEYIENVSAIGVPLAAAMIEEAAPTIGERDRNELALALAAAASPRDSEWFAGVREARHPEARLYAGLIADGQWPALRAALNKCRGNCDYKALVIKELES